MISTISHPSWTEREKHVLEGVLLRGMKEHRIIGMSVNSIEETYTIHALCHIASEDVSATGIGCESFYFNLISKVIELYPKSLEQRTTDGWSPLHIACRYSRYPWLVNMILKAKPSCIDFHGPHGWTPLHICCRYQSMDVIRAIYRAKPSDAMKLSDKKHYPHDLLRKNARINEDDKSAIADMIFLGSQSVQQALEQQTQLVQTLTAVVEAVPINGEDSGLAVASLLLEELDINEDIDRVLCESRGQEVSTKEFSQAARTPHKHGMYPLHILCQNSAPEKLLEEVLSAFPAAVNISTAYGWYPLHLICRNSDDYYAIKLILDANPQVASMTTPDGWYPLTQLCRYSSCLEAIKLVFLAYPEAAKVKVPKGLRAIDLFLKHFPSPLVLNPPGTTTSAPATAAAAVATADMGVSGVNQDTDSTDNIISHSAEQTNSIVNHKTCDRFAPIASATLSPATPAVSDAGPVSSAVLVTAIEINHIDLRSAHSSETTQNMNALYQEVCKLLRN